MTADILREKFLGFFKSKKHKIVESDSLVPKDDPTVLFTPAGMNQFKKEFLGFDAGFKRAATAQRCLRTDDLDKVGETLGHHTFFEMLGNFSFGDYFKQEAIIFAWEFLTEELKIKKDKLWVSIYKEDDEAYRVWREIIKVPAQKIVKLGDKENFWPSEAKVNGPNGPCGPCSEIFFDWAGEMDNSRSVEVWNLVFTQFNRRDGGILEPLPKKNIDTGMGLERLAAVMQGVESNFETDLFKPLVKEIESGAARSPQLKLVYAVADHIRAIVFAIYDGVLPSNDGRGYVIRKIIRKSILHLMALGIKEPFLYKLVPVLAQVMQQPYPDLKKRRENISQIIFSEERNFFTTIKSSESLFREKFSIEQNPEEVGRNAFALYDTYGIPIDLTKRWLDKNKIKISLEVFEQELAQQKDRSRMQSTMKGEVFDNQGLLSLGLKETNFLGYKDFLAKAKIIKIIKGGQAQKKITKNEEAIIVLDKTCFYAEAGGQVGDTGEIIKGKNIFEVLDTKVAAKATIHIGRVKAGDFKPNDLVTAKINLERRRNIARNHTATHILQAALRKVLGVHVKQQGSLVAPDRLRFDFTHFKDINDAELNRIEEVANDYVLANCKLDTKQMPKAQAKKSGALAFFGEKYEDKVRVVSIGEISQELCGGTHLDSTGQIGLFKIVQESSVASGIRRIEAVTGKYAYKIIKQEEDIIADIAEQLNVPPENIIPELEKRLSHVKELERQLNLKKLDIAKACVGELIQKSESINEIKFISSVIENADMDFLRRTVDLLKEKTNNSIIALGAKAKNSALLVLGVTADLVFKGCDAAKLILKPAQILGGSGGGRKDFALGGGNRPENFAAAFQELKNSIR